METKTFEISRRYSLTKVYDYGYSPTTILRLNHARIESDMSCTDQVNPLLHESDGVNSCQVVLFDKDGLSIGAYYFSEFTQIESEEKKSKTIVELALVTEASTIVLLTAYRRFLFQDKKTKISNRSIAAYAKRLQKALSICGVKEVIYCSCDMGEIPIRKSKI